MYHVHVHKRSVLFSDSSILPRTALQSVLYDDQTPEEVAEHFKKQGNEVPMKSGFHRQKSDVFVVFQKMTFSSIWVTKAMKFQASKCLGGNINIYAHVLFSSI